ncbi:uncharacterized protein CIMG_12516 [Coccidioides immitis RS]|uniref:Uncharacterized protein n=2 Tax=Coccidioides immitis TaxID=5501 RepID=A0A0D8JVB8_COCIM|nr:uncharacterized protein CIMG_12516 [Coccidioides immitis RS]KJF61265.1 hypothetical protein CIMG_12516 [Coccidioides immitis RS]KMU91907.1 hypothetical protein CIHG_09688 [Coccidioides immitis H538.4]
MEIIMTPQQSNSVTNLAWEQRRMSSAEEVAYCRTGRFLSPSCSPLSSIAHQPRNKTISIAMIPPGIWDVVSCWEYT